MIEQLARSSAEELRTGTIGDVEAGLADLHVREARHRRRTAVVAVAAVAVALGVGWSAGAVMTRDGAQPPPSHPGPTSPAPSTTPVHNTGFGGDLCKAQGVTCQGDGTYRFDLDRPVVWAVPPEFGASSNTSAGSDLVEFHRQSGPQAGVSVLEHVRAASPAGSGPARGVAHDPKSFVDWVAHRPYLKAGKVTRTTFAGHEAWQVRVVLAPGARTCDQYMCHPITYQKRQGPSGIWNDMAAQYLAFHLPGGGTTVIWSYAFTGDTSDLGALEQAVNGISFPAP
jgi:hypothetical protein